MYFGNEEKLDAKLNGMTIKRLRWGYARLYIGELRQALADDWTLLGLGPDDRADWHEIEDEIASWAETEAQWQAYDRKRSQPTLALVAA